MTAPRWLMGKTWGEADALLKVEGRFSAETCERLRAMGYPLRVTGPFDAITGHAGLLARHPDGVLEGGADPRSDGSVATF